AEEDDADRVRETWRTAVLDRPFAEARLEHVEEEEARKAPASTETQSDRELQGEEPEDRPPASEERHQRQDADDRLIRARRARVDHVGVLPWIGGARESGSHDNPEVSRRKCGAAEVRAPWPVIPAGRSCFAARALGAGSDP